MIYYMERLRSCYYYYDDGCDESEEILWNVMDRMWSAIKENKYEGLNNFLQDITETIHLIWMSGEGYRLDIDERNIMFRDPYTPVIVDPLAPSISK